MIIVAIIIKDNDNDHDDYDYAGQIYEDAGDYVLLLQNMTIMMMSE